MDKNSNAYVVVFAATVCVALAAGLAATFNGLKERIDGNNLFDKQRNVLIACGLYVPTDGVKSQAELEKMFTDKVTAKVLEFTKKKTTIKVRERGKLVDKEIEPYVSAKERPDIALADLKKAQRAEPDRILGEVYIADEGGEKIYCIPISGYGLWSTLYGFLALEEDCNTVRGITFYKHGETPGLGGEVEKEWWQKNWKGRKTHDEKKELVGITVLKGRGNDLKGRPHAVDGISGATITSNGVMKFVKVDLEKYEVYFKGL